MEPIRQPVKGTVLIITGALLAILIIGVSFFGEHPRHRISMVLLVPGWIIYRGIQCWRDANLATSTFSDSFMHSRPAEPNPVGQSCVACGRNIIFAQDGTWCRKCKSVLHTRCMDEKCPKCGSSVEPTEI